MYCASCFCLSAAVSRTSPHTCLQPLGQLARRRARTSAGRRRPRRRRAAPSSPRPRRAAPARTPCATRAWRPRPASRRRSAPGRPRGSASACRRAEYAASPRSAARRVALSASRSCSTGARSGTRFSTSASSAATRSAGRRAGVERDLAQVGERLRVAEDQREHDRVLADRRRRRSCASFAYTAGQPSGIVRLLRPRSPSRAPVEQVELRPSRRPRPAPRPAARGRPCRPSATASSTTRRAMNCRTSGISRRRRERAAPAPGRPGRAARSPYQFISGRFASVASSAWLHQSARRCPTACRAAGAAVRTRGTSRTTGDGSLFASSANFASDSGGGRRRLAQQLDRPGADVLARGRRAERAERLGVEPAGDVQRPQRAQPLRRVELGRRRACSRSRRVNARSRFQLAASRRAPAAAAGRAARTSRSGAVAASPVPSSVSFARSTGFACFGSP